MTSDGTTPGSALVWVMYSDGATGSNGQLRAYDAVPVNGVMRLRWSASIGTAAKFAVPATDSGRVFVGTRDGHLLAFGRPANSALVGSPVDLGSVPVGSTGQGTATVTASRTLTVSQISAPAPFGVTPPSLPVTLQAGQSLSVPVRFTPTGPGPVTAVLSYVTSVATVGVDLRGTGTRPGFGATPSTLAFGDRSVGSSMTLTVNITNTDSKAETIGTVTQPTAPFTAAGLPASGTVLAAGASVAVSVTYTPTTAQQHSSSLGVSGPAGSVTVPLTGTGITGQAQLAVTPSTLDFGQVPVGRSVTRTFDVANSGDLALTISKAAPPTAPFSTPVPVAEGQVLNPGDVVHQTITFTPGVLGAATGTYLLVSDDGTGQHPVTLSGAGVAPSGGAVLPAPTAGGWSLNGAAKLSGTDLQLTPASANTAGSAVFPTPVPSDGLHAQFTAVIGGGTGADGMTLTLLDPATNSTGALGSIGGGLGYAGLTGVAVTLDTYKGGSDPSANFVAVATGGTQSALTYAATSTAIGNLRTASHVVDVAVSGATVTVSVDGVAVLSPSVGSLPPSVLVAFTASTGGRTDLHAARDVAITSAGYALPAPYAPGWVRNGAATLSGTDLVVTPATASVAGSSWYRGPVPSSGLHARFTAVIGGGTGADGMTLTLLDPATNSTGALGSIGGGLGYAGLKGVAVTLDTYQGGSDPSANFVAVATGGTQSALIYAATSTAVGNLRTGTHAVDVTVTPAGHVVVRIDGAQVIDVPVTLPANVIPGFTAATGGRTDQHTVRDAVIGY